MADANAIAIPYRTKDLTGKRFGRLTVLEFSACRANGAHWLCRCECGNETVVGSVHLGNGHSQSCGCFGREQRLVANTTHGMSNTPEFRSWAHTLSRCYNTRVAKYPRYGGRGIQVCDRWRISFEAFFADMGPKPSPRHSIERIDNDGNYEPGNCVWATAPEQSRNKSNTVRLTFAGRTQCVAAWAEELGMRVTTLWGRLNRGWSVERTLTEPVGHGRASASSATPRL